MHEKMRANLQALMSEAQISERKLATACGFNQSSLNRFMAGLTSSMSLDHVMAMANYFDLTVSQLIGETGFTEDRKIRSVLIAMEHMPEYKKDALVAASTSLVESTPKIASGSGEQQ